MEELYFKFPVNAGLKELDEGNGIHHNVVKEGMAKWLKNNLVPALRR